MTQAIAAAEQRLTACVRHGRTAAIQIAYFAVAAQVRQTTGSFLDWRWPGVLVGGVVSWAICALLTASFLGGMAGGVVAAIIFACLFYFPGNAALKARHETLRTAMAEWNNQQARERQRIPALTAQLTAARQQHETLVKTLRQAEWLASAKYRREQFLQRPWKELRGGELEKFLAEVFRELGYAVDQTGKTGDQGADLVVSRGNRRLAVQVKGREGTVGNGAVQEAHTAKSIYHCVGCCVITNSLFSPSAKVAANSVGCILIDETQLPDLVRGTFSID